MKTMTDSHVRKKGDGQVAPQDKASRIMAGLRLCLPEILKHHPVLLAYAYGSVAAGCPTPLSDVDIALVLSPDCGLDAYQRFMLELEIAAEIERHCGIQNADVRSINDAPLRVQGQVVTRGRLLYSKDTDFRVAYEVRTRKRYFDFRPVLVMMREAYFARLEADLRRKALYG
ncbi:MAG: nucleotidyltransferase domain-containing protein [Anaerolineae bacterium]